jgi:hypothetical protein
MAWADGTAKHLYMDCRCQCRGQELNRVVAAFTSRCCIREEAAEFACLSRRCGNPNVGVTAISCCRL